MNGVLERFAVENIWFNLVTFPLFNEGVRGKSFPPTGRGVEPRKKKML